jgi:hypothetical protein
MNQDASWNRKVIECGAFLERKLRQVERFGTIAFEHQSPSVVVERIKDDDSPKERAIAILECVYELRNDLRPKEMEYLQEIYKSLKRLLIDCGAKPDEVQEYMVGAIWQGSICMILEICSSVLEDLFAKVVDAKWDFPIGYNGVTITELSPAFKITMPFFVKVTVPEGRQVPDVWLLEEDRAKFLLPTCDAARSCIMQGGRQLSEFCIKDMVHDALKSLPTFRRTEGNTLVSWHSIQQESTSVGHFLRSLPTYSENSVGQSAKPSGGWTPHSMREQDEALLKATEPWSSNGELEKAQKALKNGANVNIQDGYGYTPLHYASWHGHDAIVSLLLENDADVNIQDKWGCTPLHRAAWNGNETALSMLLENGADYTITNNKGETPLELAQQQKMQNCVAAIIQRQQGKTNSRELQQLKLEERPAQERNGASVFLSHTGHDETARNFTAHLKESLDQNKISAFYDMDSINCGEQWTKTMEDVVNCRVFVAILSPTYFKQYWCMRELLLAVKHERTVLPIYYSLDGPDKLPQNKADFCNTFQSKNGFTEEELDELWDFVSKTLPDIQGRKLSHWQGRKDADTIFKNKIVQDLELLLG